MFIVYHKLVLIYFKIKTKVKINNQYYYLKNSK